MYVRFSEPRALAILRNALAAYVEALSQEVLLPDQIQSATVSADMGSESPGGI